MTTTQNTLNYGQAAHLILEQAYSEDANPEVQKILLAAAGNVLQEGAYTE